MILTCRECGGQFEFALVRKGPKPRYCADECRKSAEKRYITRYKKALRDSRRERGLCPECGRQPLKNRVNCPGCERKTRTIREKAARRRGMCSGCARRKATKGKKTCEKCRKRPHKCHKKTA